MERAIGAILGIRPLIFAFGFLTPVLAQAMAAAGWTAPWGLGNIAFAAAICGALGTLAMLRGRWI